MCHLMLLYFIFILLHGSFMDEYYLDLTNISDYLNETDTLETYSHVYYVQTVPTDLQETSTVNLEQLYRVLLKHLEKQGLFSGENETDYIPSLSEVYGPDHLKAKNINISQYENLNENQLAGPHMTDQLLQLLHKAAGLDIHNSSDRPGKKNYTGLVEYNAEIYSTESPQTTLISYAEYGIESTTETMDLEYDDEIEFRMNNANKTSTSKNLTKKKTTGQPETRTSVKKYPKLHAKTPSSIPAGKNLKILTKTSEPGDDADNTKTIDITAEDDHSVPPEDQVVVIKRVRGIWMGGRCRCNYEYRSHGRKIKENLGFVFYILSVIYYTT